MTEKEDKIGKCVQCDKFAVTDNPPLCVEHFLMYEQALHIKLTWLATQQNFVSDQLDQGTGYLIQHPKINIPKNPLIGETLNLNYINVGKGNIEIKAETIQNIDVTIGLIKSEGNEELANQIKRLTEAVNNSKDFTREIINEIAEQLAFVSTQVSVKDEERKKGIIKSLLSGLKDTLSTSAALITIWNQFEPLIRAALGV